MLEIVKEFQSDNIFIFGRYDCASKFKRRWAKVVKDSNVPHHKMSSSRHTFATLMLRENIVSINELSGLLGHAKAKTTLECYASVIKADNLNLGTNFSLFGHNMVTIRCRFWCHNAIMGISRACLFDSPHLHLIVPK